MQGRGMPFCVTSCFIYCYMHACFLILLVPLLIQYTVSDVCYFPSYFRINFFSSVCIILKRNAVSCKVLMGCCLEHWGNAPSVLVLCITLEADIVAMVMYLHGASVHTQLLSLNDACRNGKSQKD